MTNQTTAGRLSRAQAPPMEEELRAAAEAATGFMPLAEGLALYRTAAAYAPVGPVLEVGSYCGKSTIYLAAAARSCGQRVVTIDHHHGSADRVGEIRRHLVHQDVQFIVVVHVEHLRDQSGADGVGLAQHPIDHDPHDPPLSSARRRARARGADGSALGCSRGAMGPRPRRTGARMEP